MRPFAALVLIALGALNAAPSEIRGVSPIANPAFPSFPARPEPSKSRPFTASDLDGYFSSGRARESKVEFDRGNFALARTLLLNEGTALPVRYLRALSALRAEDYQAAALEMSALGAEYLVLRDRCLFYAATAYEEMRQWDAAADHFGRVEGESRLYPDARLGLARALHHGGQRNRAVEVATQLAKEVGTVQGRDVAAEALFAAAEMRRESRDVAAERDTLIQLWSGHPLSPFASEAARRLKGIKLPPEAVVLRAERLIDAHRNRQGMVLLEPLLQSVSPPDALGCRVHFAYGKALRKERRHAKAVAVLGPVTAQCREPDLLARGLFALSSSRSIIDPQRAAETYEELARDFPGQAFADDALFYAADLHFKAGQPQLALSRLEELAEKYPAGDFFAEALFRSAWIHRHQNQTESQLRLLNELEVRFANSDPYEVQRAQYWRARTLESLGDRRQAVELLSSLSQKYPTSYYGLMARLRVEKLDSQAYSQVAPWSRVADAASDPWPFYPGPMEQEPHFQSAVELLRLGFPESAISELLAVNRSARPPQALRLLAQLLTLAGDVRSAQAVARESLRVEMAAQITGENRALWERAYPLPFRDFTEQHCRAEDVDPDLLQALMREESALDPRALSPAGALGLTQLMLPTAQVLAKALKMPRMTSESLLRPDYSIRLGAHYLATLLRQFNGNVAHALAAYNAGPLAVRRWSAALPEAELDEWIEEIPISETRGYVKRVLRTYNTYRLLYAREVQSEGPLLSRLLAR